MKVTVEHDPAAENEVVLRCASLDDEMLRVLSLLRAELQRLCVWDEERRLHLLTPSQLIYAETVEDKTFICTAGAIYQTALGLGELEGRFAAVGLFRANKSTVVNLHHIKSLQSCGAGRIQADLATGEKLMVSRRYAPLLRERLGL